MNRQDDVSDVGFRRRADAVRVRRGVSQRRRGGEIRRGKKKGPRVCSYAFFYILNASFYIALIFFYFFFSNLSSPLYSLRAHASVTAYVVEQN